MRYTNGHQQLLATFMQPPYSIQEIYDTIIV